MIVGNFPDYETLPLNKEFPYSKSLQQFLHGRKLLSEEIPFSLETIHEHYLNGYVAYYQGITDQKRDYVCNRCGNKQQHLFARHHCARCETECVYCRSCIMMGKVARCSRLLTWSGPPIKFEKRECSLEWTGMLSPEQQIASEKITAAVGKSGKMLIWAV